MNLRKDHYRLLLTLLRKNQNHLGWLLFIERPSRAAHPSVSRRNTASGSLVLSRPSELPVACYSGVRLWPFKALRSQRSGFLEPSPRWDVEKLCVVMDSFESQELSGSESEKKYNTVQWITWLGGR